MNASSTASATSSGGGLFSNWRIELIVDRICGSKREPLTIRGVHAGEEVAPDLGAVVARLDEAHTHAEPRELAGQRVAVRLDRVLAHAVCADHRAGYDTI